METKKIYSIDGESYNDWETVYDQLISSHEHYIGEKIEIYEADSIRATHKQFINTDLLIENITEAAFEDFDELADDYLSEINESDCNELRLIIEDFLIKKAKPINFFNIYNEKKITVTIED